MREASVHFSLCRRRGRAGGRKEKYWSLIPHHIAGLKAIRTSAKADPLPRRATFFAVACDAVGSRYIERHGASTPDSSIHRQSSIK
jgi:hypothetical protein